MRFKVSDRVKIQINDDKLSDLKADLLSDVVEGDIPGATYDRICAILEKVAENDSPIFIVTEAKTSWHDNEPLYALKSGKTSMRYMWEEEFLIPV